MVSEHRGDTPQTALALPPHFDLDLPFPLNEYLGADDQVWLRVKPRATLMGTTRSESIVLDTGAGRRGPHDPVRPGRSPPSRTGTAAAS